MGEAGLFRGGGFGYRLRDRCFGSWLVASFGQNLDLDLCSNFAVEPDGYGEFAQALEGLGEVDLAAIDLEALGCEIGSDIG